MKERHTQPMVRNISELAAIAGVAPSTVSRALANNPTVRKETRERIQGIARQHNFRKDEAAQRLAARKGNQKPETASPYLSQYRGDNDKCLMKEISRLLSFVANRKICADSYRLNESHHCEIRGEARVDKETYDYFGTFDEIKFVINIYTNNTILESADPLE